MAGFKLKVKSNNYEQFKKDMADVKSLVVKVGLMGESAAIKDEGGFSVVDYGAANEFGTATIPERSYIRSTMDERAKRFAGKGFQLGQEIMAGTITKTKALMIMGQLIAVNIIQKINSIHVPPNAPSTIEQKGSSKPLVDKGRLRQSITYEVTSKANVQ
jgi:hypothetical protein